LVEYTGCDPNVLDDLKRIEALMNEAATAARTNIVASVFQPFEPQGVTGVVVVEESHLSIHTWPECGYAAVDFFTCGESMPERAHEVLVAGLKAQFAELMHVERGTRVPGRGLQLRSHHTEVNADPSGDEVRQVSDAAMARLVS
jgi:S-adenosylmethionine decarboxylase proenzyme